MAGAAREDCAGDVLLRIDGLTTKVGETEQVAWHDLNLVLKKGEGRGCEGRGGGRGCLGV